MRLLPPYEPPPPPKITKCAAIQMAWERGTLLKKANDLARKAWKLISSKGTASEEYQKIFLEHRAILGRIAEIDSISKQ